MTIVYDGLFSTNQWDLSSSGIQLSILLILCGMLTGELLGVSGHERFPIIFPTRSCDRYHRQTEGNKEKAIGKTYVLLAQVLRRPMEH